MRFYTMTPIQDWEKMADIVAKEGRGDDWVRWGAVKGLSDGSLGSRTAVFHDDYADAAGQRGVRVNSLGESAHLGDGRRQTRPAGCNTRYW